MEASSLISDPKYGSRPLKVETSFKTNALKHAPAAVLHATEALA